MANRQGFTPELEESSLENRSPGDCIRRKVTNMLDVHTRQPVTRSLGKGSCAGGEFSCLELCTRKTTHGRASPMARAEPTHPSEPLGYGDVRPWGRLPTSHCCLPGRAPCPQGPQRSPLLALVPQNIGMQAAPGVQHARSSGCYGEAGKHADG